MVIAGCPIITSQYMDIPGFSDKLQAGRTKNAISTVISGIVAQEAYRDSIIDIQVQKKFYPDSEIKGYVSNRRIDANMDLMLTSSHLKAAKDDMGMLEGNIEKSELDWRLEETNSGNYKIARWGPKFDCTLKLDVSNGKISGVYERPFTFDWSINGTYDNKGNVDCKISVPLGLDIGLEGKITPSNWIFFQTYLNLLFVF